LLAPIKAGLYSKLRTPAPEGPQYFLAPCFSFVRVQNNF
jgi:hypothetical protein